MIVNLHTHTARCNHASGTEEEYVARAIEGGLQTLGFSDHTPFWFPDGYYTYMRMQPHELADYVETVNALKAKYASQLDIRLGLEVEYYPAFVPEVLSRAKDMGIEYFLLGQHWCGNEIDEPYNGRPTMDEKLLERYCDQVIDAMHTGLFTYVAHPDLLHFVGENHVYEPHARRLCQAAKSCNLPLEINLLGLREGRHYPRYAFWQVAAEENCTVVLGSDAHCPIDVVDPQTEQRTLDMISQLGLTYLENPDIRRI